MLKPIILFSMASACLAASALDIKIYGDVQDTVSTASQYIIGCAAPSATVTINGQPATTNALGSFALKVDLKDGDNPVDIKASLGNESASKQLNVFRKSPKAKIKAANAPAPEAESIYASPFFVKTTEGAYMQYGNADDRLGGSKMGFLAPGIPLKVVGESNDLYKVQLSQQRWAYVPKEHTEASQEATRTVTTGSWSVSNQGRFDRISVALPIRLPYFYYTQLDPSTLVVELYGAMDNSNWIVQRSKQLGMVDYAYFEQPQSDVYRIIIRLKEKYQWGFSVGYEGNNLTIDVRHCPADLSFKGLTIGLDAGHGGPYPGAYSPSGLTEKEVNLDIILRLRTLLEKAGAKVVLTRDSDTGPSMTERKKILREAGVDLSVSVHNNWTSDPLSAPGTSTYYKHLFDRPLAEALVDRMLETGLNLYGLTGNFNFSLNGPTEYPNALVEAMFMNSLEEEEKLASPEFRQLVAKKIFLALDDYLKKVKSSRK